jgi:hypothetical protein
VAAKMKQMATNPTTISLTAATTAALADRFIRQVPLTGKPKTDAYIVLGGGVALLLVGWMALDKHPHVQAACLGIGAGATLAGALATWG